MFNYKKSLLSLATVAALAVAPVSANYIPLADATGADEQWTLFGVTGLKTSGAGSGTTAGTFSIADNIANAVSDNTLDDLFVSGLIASSSESLARVKVLSPFSLIEVRVDTTGAVFSETEPVRTMYVTMTEGGGPAFAFTYRASLEGHTMQYSTSADGSNAHSIKISSVNTYNNPGLGTVIQEIAGIPGSSLSGLSDMVDYNLDNNPANSAYYDRDVHQDVAGVGEYLRVYSYDAINEVWELYDSRNAADVNDFSELKKGKAYWAKMNNPANSGGLVLGSSSITSSEYTAAGITDGWNLMAFDNANPYIRKSETGFLVTTDGDDVITIYDASGNHSVAIAITDNTNEVATCDEINIAIKNAILDGTMPASFDLRVIPTGTGQQYAFLSTKRFLLDDSGTGSIAAVTTLAGLDPFVVSDAQNPTDGEDLTIVDLGTTAGAINGGTIAMSKYGEYALIIEALHGVGTASAQAANAARIHLQSAASNATTVSALSVDNGGAIATTAATLSTDIGGHNAVATAVDTNLDATADSILIASAEPFYVRDHTFTRVFEYTDVAEAEGETTISGTTTAGTYADTGAAQTAAAFITALEGVNSIQGVVDATQIVLISSDDDSNEFTVTENTGATATVGTLFDQLVDATNINDISKGAVKGVYSLTSFASSTLTNTLESGNALTNLDAMDDGTDTILVSVTTPTGTYTEAAATAITGVAGAVSVSDFTTFVQAQIEAWLAESSILYDSVTVTNTDPAVVTIVSTEVIDFTITATLVGGSVATNTAIPLAASTTLGRLTTVVPDLADDLKFNAIYAPNYVTDGPLYTMKDTSYTLKALVTGTTDLSDGSVNWDSIDLTRTPSEWLDSQDYNLFKVNENSGYWSFVEADSGSNTLTVANAALSPIVYTHRFNETDVNYNSVSGNIALTIDGLDVDDRAVPVVSATIAGSTIELANINGSNIYTGKVSSYEIESMVAGYNYEILANAADGLGYNLKAEDVGLIVDFTKPAAPTIDLSDGTSVAFASTSDDVAGYYVFNGQIPEENTVGATNLFVNLTAAEAAAYGLCQETSKLAWNDTAYELNVVAVDGAGTLGKGNVSDTTTENYVPMLKDAIRLVDSNAADSDATILGTVYNSECVSTGAQTVNYGVTLTSETDLQTVKIAYEPENVTDLTATPVSLFVNSTNQDASVIAKITYASVYAGETIYVELEGIVYSLLLPTSAEIIAGAFGGSGVAANDGASSANPLDLSAGPGFFSELQAGQSL